MIYEAQKNEGSLPIVGVNTFLSPQGSEVATPRSVSRSSEKEKEEAIQACKTFQQRNRATSSITLNQLKAAARQGSNVFAALLEASKVCTLGQLTQALYDVGGQYRRNM